MARSDYRVDEATRTGAVDNTLALLQTLRQAIGFELPVRLWDGTEAGERDGFRVVLNHPWSARSLLGRDVDLSAGEAYVWGDIDVEGDMVAALHKVASIGHQGGFDRSVLARLLRQARRLPSPPGRPDRRRARLRGPRHSRGRDRAAISFHYDLPTDFYRTFLDRELVYSCGYFAELPVTTPERHLDEAQHRKLEMVCRKLRLKPGMRFLDVGCGWGSLILHAARHHGVSALGVTLSDEQASFARERIEREGLSDRVEVRLADYRELGETFDAIASVGMVEHVGPNNLLAYFTKQGELLADDGLLLNHGIVTRKPDEGHHVSPKSFVGRYVFPDGGLAPVWRVVREAERAELTITDVHQLRPHYAATLTAWVRRLEASRNAILDVATDVDYRIWRAYMAGSAVNFATGGLGVIQLLASKRLPSLPAGRGWMEPSG